MERLGSAQLIQVKNATGATVKAWDLRPFGGEPLQLGLVSSPMPPAGSTTDRTLANGAVLQIDLASGDVFQKANPRVDPAAAAAEPPPTVGPVGGPPPKPKMSPFVLAALAGAALFFLKGGRR